MIPVIVAIIILFTLNVTNSSGGIRKQNCDCGVEKVTGRIINGEVVEKFDKPFVVFLVRKNGGQQFCGGTVISDKHVVTANHCVKNDLQASEIQVVVLTLDKTKPKPENIYNVIQIIKMPYYDDNITRFDISILELEKTLDANAIPPICLPPFAMKNYTDLLAMGWGQTENGTDSNVLRQVWLNQTDFVTCNSFWTIGLDEVVQLCAGKWKKDACFGDSGGPLMMKSKGKWILVGIVSFGYNCAVNDDAVYTRVAYFVPWIHYWLEKRNGVICNR